MAFVFTRVCKCLLSKEEDRSGKERTALSQAALLMVLASSGSWGGGVPSLQDPKPPRSRRQPCCPEQLHICSRLRIAIIWERVKQVRAPDGRRAALT